MLRKLAIKVGVLLEAHPEAIRATKLSAILAELRDSGECERHSGVAGHASVHDGVASHGVDDG